MSQLAVEGALHHGIGLHHCALVIQGGIDQSNGGLVGRHECVQRLALTLVAARTASTTRARSSRAATVVVVASAVSHIVEDSRG